MFGQQKEIICIDVDNPEGCVAADSDEVKSLKEDINSLIDTREGLLHSQQDYNNGNANQRRTNYQAKIDDFETKAGNAANATAAARWQAKADALKVQRDFHDSEEVGSPRDEANKLGPQISALMQEINDLKQELRAIE